MSKSSVGVLIEEEGSNKGIRGKREWLEQLREIVVEHYLFTKRSTPPPPQQTGVGGGGGE
jgi:hypothetical protein